MNPPSLRQAQCGAFTSQTLISEVFERQREAVALFIDHGTDCIGCIMAPFCTLGEMSLHYGVELDEFLRELTRLGGEDSPSMA